MRRQASGIGLVKWRVLSCKPPLPRVRSAHSGVRSQCVARRYAALLESVSADGPCRELLGLESVGVDVLVESTLKVRAASQSAAAAAVHSTVAADALRSPA